MRAKFFLRPIFSFLFGWMPDQSLHVAFLHSEAAGTSWGLWTLKLMSMPQPCAIYIMLNLWGVLLGVWRSFKFSTFSMCFSLFFSIFSQEFLHVSPCFSMQSDIPLSPVHPSRASVLAVPRTSTPPWMATERACGSPPSKCTSMAPWSDELWTAIAVV